MKDVNKGITLLPGQALIIQAEQTSCRLLAPRLPDLSSQRGDEGNKQKTKEKGGRREIKNERSRRQKPGAGEWAEQRAAPGSAATGAQPSSRPSGWAGGFLPTTATRGCPRPLPTTALPPSASSAPTEGPGPDRKADPGPGPSAPGSRRGSRACPAEAAPAPPRVRPLPPSLSTPHGGRPLAGEAQPREERPEPRMGSGLRGSRYDPAPAAGRAPRAGPPLTRRWCVSCWSCNRPPDLGGGAWT